VLQGIKEGFDKKKILKAIKKEHCCNGTVVEDEELGFIIQVQGDQRKNIADFLTTVRTTPTVDGVCQPVFGVLMQRQAQPGRCTRHLLLCCVCFWHVSAMLRAMWRQPAICLQNKIVKKDMIKVHGF